MHHLFCKSKNYFKIKAFKEGEGMRKGAGSRTWLSPGWNQGSVAFVGLLPGARSPAGNRAFGSERLGHPATGKVPTGLAAGTPGGLWTPEKGKRPSPCAPLREHSALIMLV